MLTESREAMNLRNQAQNLAIASLSSPQFDANPFLPPAAMCPFYRCKLPLSCVAAMVLAAPLWESTADSNQVDGAAALPFETRF
jgi:hypothetical protein